VTAYLELADYLLVAEAVLGVPAELIADFNRIGLADSALAAPQAGFGGVEAYPDFETKAAVLLLASRQEPPAARWQQAVRVPGHGRVPRAQRPELDPGTR